MDNVQKTLIFGFATLLIVVLIVWFVLQGKKAPQTQPQVIVVPNGSNTPDNSAQVQDLKTQLQMLQAQAQAQEMKGNDNFPLQPGSVGDRVKKLQTFLQKKYGYMGKIDGKWGFQTNFAVENNMKMKTISEAIFTNYGLQNIPI